MSKLQEVRIERGLSQSGLAIASEVSKRTLQEYEQSRVSVDGAKLKTLLKFADVLDCRVSDIVECPELVQMLKKRGM